MQSLKSLAAEVFFVPVQNQLAKSPREQTIPPIVYQTWETSRFGKKHAESIAEVRRLNDDLSFFLFDRSSRDNYMRDFWKDRLIYEIYTRAQFGALRADIFRYCLIYERGGYYFDISKGISNRLTSLHLADAIGLISFENNEFTGNPGPPALRHPSNLVIQWGFGFAEKSLLLESHIERIESSYGSFLGKVFHSPKLAILEFTGPISFTRSLHEFAAKETNMEKIVQTGKDFDSFGIFSLPGSGSRYLVSPSYAKIKNKAILK